MLLFLRYRKSVQFHSNWGLFPLNFLMPVRYINLRTLENPQTWLLTIMCMRIVDKLHAARNLDENICYKLQALFERDERLEDINEEKNELRYKTKDGKLGKAAVDNIKCVISNLKPFLLSILEVSSEKFDEIIVQFSKEMEDNDSYHDMRRVYG
ncbi:18262_t:CDS:2, partial [Acaulospora morrowiae]